MSVSQPGRYEGIDPLASVAAGPRVHAPVAQLDRARVYGTRGRRCESTRARRRRLVVQTASDDYLAKSKRLGYSPMHGWF